MTRLITRLRSSSRAAVPAAAPRSLQAALGGWMLLCTLFALLALTPGAWAQSGNEPDPPGRAGRLADVQGRVWLYDTEEGDWVEAVRNRPLTTGDRVSSERGGRAEVRVGSTAILLDEGTELEITRLDDEHLNLQLHRGGVAVRLRTRDAAKEFELVTAEGRFTADRAGSYRFDRDDDTTDATALAGSLQLRADDAGVTVKAGQRYEFWNDNGTQYQLSEVRNDDFSEWVAERDRREERSVSAKYASAEMTGIEDLDRYGRWEQDAEQGPLWIPSGVSATWAPYRTGHWVWVRPWGWTWVDDAPWGFAPFHYGRWVHRHNVWCWSPGRYVQRPVYAPALVAWIGGSGVSVTLTSGRRPSNVGWFPLGPREVYVPGYRYSPAYMRAVNDNHVPRGFNLNPFIRDPHRAVLDARYRHRNFAPAVTVVPVRVLERRQPVGPAIIAIGGRPVPGIDRQRPRPDAPVRPIVRERQPDRATPVPAAPGSPGGRFFAERLPGGFRGDRGPDRRVTERAPERAPDRPPEVRPGARSDAQQDPRLGGRPFDRDDRRNDARNDGRNDGREPGRRDRETAPPMPTVRPTPPQVQTQAPPPAGQPPVREAEQRRPAWRNAVQGSPRQDDAGQQPQRPEAAPPRQTPVQEPAQQPRAFRGLGGGSGERAAPPQRVQQPQPQPQPVQQAPQPPMRQPMMHPRQPPVHQAPVQQQAPQRDQRSLGPGPGRANDGGFPRHRQVN